MLITQMPRVFVEGGSADKERHTSLKSSTLGTGGGRDPLQPEGPVTCIDGAGISWFGPAVGAGLCAPPIPSQPRRRHRGAGVYRASQ